MPRLKQFISKLESPQLTTPTKVEEEFLEASEALLLLSAKKQGGGVSRTPEGMRIIIFFNRVLSLFKVLNF